MSIKIIQDLIQSKTLKPEHVLTIRYVQEKAWFDTKRTLTEDFWYVKCEDNKIHLDRIPDGLKLAFNLTEQNVKKILKIEGMDIKRFAKAYQIK